MIITNSVGCRVSETIEWYVFLLLTEFEHLLEDLGIGKSASAKASSGTGVLTQLQRQFEGSDGQVKATSSSRHAPSPEEGTVGRVSIKQVSPIRHAFLNIFLPLS